MTRPTENLQMPSHSLEQPALPTNRAFVLQFTRATDRGASACGRIEHVSSGKTAQFGSWKQVRDFIELVLAGVVDGTERTDSAAKDRNARGRRK
jgi:hypothetical protein